MCVHLHPRMAVKQNYSLAFFSWSLQRKDLGGATHKLKPTCLSTVTPSGLGNCLFGRITFYPIHNTTILNIIYFLNEYRYPIKNYFMLIGVARDNQQHKGVTDWRLSAATIYFAKYPNACPLETDAQNPGLSHGLWRLRRLTVPEDIMIIPFIFCIESCQKYFKGTSGLSHQRTYGNSAKTVI